MTHGCGRALITGLALAAAVACVASPLLAQDSAAVRETGRDSVSVRIVDADLRSVVQSLGRYLPKPVVTGNLPAVRVSLETPEPVSRRTIAALLRGLVESHGLEFTEDPAFIRIGPKPSPAPGAARGAATASGPAAATPVKLFVVRLRHARAADVAATVNQLFGNGGAFSGQGGLSTGTLSDELRRSAVPRHDAAPAALPPTQGGAASLSGPAVIVPDELTNSLLIRTGESDYQVLSDAIEQLDVRPLQVLVEVLIVEFRADRSLGIGTSLFVPPQPLSGDASGEGELIGAGLGDIIVRLMNLGKADIDAILSLAHSKGDVKIISRPVLLASNNTEARFLVGSQRPFVQVSRSLPTDSPTRDQVVQYRDVGTALTIRPTINPDGYVSLLVQQEINAATNETQFNAPVISTREATTQVLVRDGQTIVIGGLRDQQTDRTRTGVPLLSDIPILGGLFGSTSSRRTDTELFLFLTPRILRTDGDVDRVTSQRVPEGIEP